MAQEHFLQFLPTFMPRFTKHPKKKKLFYLGSHKVGAKRLHMVRFSGPKAKNLVNISKMPLGV